MERATLKTHGTQEPAIAGRTIGGTDGYGNFGAIDLVRLQHGPDS